MKILSKRCRNGIAGFVFASLPVLELAVLASEHFLPCSLPIWILFFRTENKC